MSRDCRELIILFKANLTTETHMYMSKDLNNNNNTITITENTYTWKLKEELISVCIKINWTELWTEVNPEKVWKARCLILSCCPIMKEIQCDRIKAKGFASVISTYLQIRHMIVVYILWYVVYFWSIILKLFH